MKKHWILIALVLAGLVHSLRGMAAPQDVYLILFLTYDGKTGHAAIAVDQYHYTTVEKMVNGRIQIVRDTVKSGTLIYYDLWPSADGFDKVSVEGDVKALYYKLPATSWQEITLASLYDEGIPHKPHLGPCDGILKLSTTPWEAERLKTFLENLMQERTDFNVRNFNCADFVRLGIEHLLGVKLEAREFIPFAFSTTPNKLFQTVAALPEVRVVKDPGPRVQSSFWEERIVKKDLLGRLQVHHDSH